MSERVQALKKLYIFNDWHQDDLVFLARWMLDKTFIPVRDGGARGTV